MFITKNGWEFASQVKWLQKYLKHGGFIAGGAFKDIFTNKRIKDLDLFATSLEDILTIIQSFEEDEEYEQYYTSDNVTAFKHKETGIIVECVRKVWGTPEQIIGLFDFTITKFVAFMEEVPNSPGPDGTPWCDENGDDTRYELHVLYHPEYFEHLNLKRLVIDDKLLYPVDTYHRLFKYGKRGYFPCRGTKIKIAQALREVEPWQIDNIAFYRRDGID